MNFEDFEDPVQPLEKEPKILSLEEIKNQIERFVNQENLEKPRVLEDEKGVYLYEVTVVDEKGDASVYAYRRKGDFREFVSPTVIDVTYYSGSGEEAVLCGGTTLSDYNKEADEWVDS